MDIDTLKKTQLTKRELASILGVSRITVHNYFNGAKPNYLRVSRIDKTIAILKELVKKQKLPLKSGFRSQDEKARRAGNVEKIKEFIDSHLID